MKNYLTLVLLCMVIQTSFSQFLQKETLSSQGSSHFVYATNKSYFIQESIGQASVIKTFATNSKDLRQGFLQPLSVSVLYDQLAEDIDAVIWPNPFSNVINVQFNEPVVGPIEIKLYDPLGRLVMEQGFNPNPRLIIPMGELATGSYFFQLQSKLRSLVVKLIKQQ